MDSDIISLVQSGMKAEADNDFGAAHKFYEEAWSKAEAPKQRSIAAHFLARTQNTKEGRFKWNRIAIDEALKIESEVKEYFPSLYYCMGLSCEECGDKDKALTYYKLAQSKISDLPQTQESLEYNDNLIKQINEKLES